MFLIRFNKIIIGNILYYNRNYIINKINNKKDKENNREF